MFNPTDFPKPTLISVNGVELEVFEAGRVVNLDCGHWIQQEKPEETNQAILKWLEQQGAT